MAAIATPPCPIMANLYPIWAQSSTSVLNVLELWSSNDFFAHPNNKTQNTLVLILIFCKTGKLKPQIGGESFFVFAFTFLLLMVFLCGRGVIWKRRHTWGLGVAPLGHLGRDFPKVFWVSECVRANEGGAYCSSPSSRNK
jgi:hypothetical protein